MKEENTPMIVREMVINRPNLFVRPLSLHFAKEARTSLLEKFGRSVLEVTITKKYEGFRATGKERFLVIKIKVDSQQVRDAIETQLAVSRLHELSKELGIK